jgi:hypothetical protein
MQSELSPSSIVQRLVELRQEHRDLDLSIQLITQNASDEITIKRLKKRKLKLKDMIAQLENMLIPDEPA